MTEYDANKEFFLSPKMKMADLVNANPDLLNILDRFGIRLGFGEDSVEQCCRKQDKDAFTFLMICRIAAYGGYLPGSSELDKVKVADLTGFLRSSHDSYQDAWLPELESKIDVVLSGRPDAQKKVISEFFVKFKDELHKHFEMEEKKIFPSLDAIGKKGKGARRIFKEEHDNIGEKIQDLINLLLKYLPYGNPDTCVTVLLTHLFFLKKDLATHSRIEDCLILPLLKGGESHE